MLSIICRLLLLLTLVAGVACASFEATAAVPAFRLLPQLRMKKQNRLKSIHRPIYHAYKPYRC
ncbi:hypothetical protein [Hymenobacter norwichensis]|uniref:hypothetical protein n=1 Tax=Hymenobacter norwichensis TaxID=223903 RepID=UPI0003B5605E|nr:hypothetical protein [Hymenobacter norwichensis]